MLADSLRDLAAPIADLRPLPGNPRRGDVAAVARSLKRFGQRKPIVARRDGTVVAGNHTLQAALDLGWKHIAVVWVDEDEATSKAFALADNRTSALGAFHPGDLAAMVAEVHAVDPDLLLAASYDGAELDTPAEAPAPAADADADDVPEPPADPVTKPGDIWHLGPHRVICGDARDPATVARLLDGQLVNVAFTSPPYASQRKYDETSGFRPIPPDEYVDWFEAVQANVRAHLADDGLWFVNIKEHSDGGQRVLYVKDLTIAHVRRWGWRFVDELCWVDSGNGFPGGYVDRFKDAWEPVFCYALNKGIKFRPLANATESKDSFLYAPETELKMRPGGYMAKDDVHRVEGLARPSNVITLRAGGARGVAHSAQFPVALPAWFIRAYSDAGDVVFDPFMGSGSTLIAADREGRVAYGSEISPAYVDVICRRYQEATGVVPVLASTGQPHDFL